jgi:hypothetical protein
MEACGVPETRRCGAIPYDHPLNGPAYVAHADGTVTTLNCA